MNEKVLLTDTMEQTANIFGNFDMNTAMIEKAFGVSITNRKTQFILSKNTFLFYIAKYTVLIHI